MTSSIPHTRKSIAIVALVLAAATLAGCENIVYGPSPQAARMPEAPMTRSRAASECWMATEKGRGDMNLDQRADVVTKCIERKLKEAKAK